MHEGTWIYEGASFVNVTEVVIVRLFHKKKQVIGQTRAENGLCN